MIVQAVLFDLDGILIDSEQVWDDVRRRLVDEVGGTWRDDAQRTMMGMSAGEWTRYMHDTLKVPLPPEEILRAVTSGLERSYRERPPVIDGAVAAVEALAANWPLALATSSHRAVAEFVLRSAGIAKYFTAVVSSEEVGRGKPAPDVYLEAARRVGFPPERCVAVEDSTNGLRAALAAGTIVIAIPNPHYPPDPATVERSALVLQSIRELDTAAVNTAALGSPGVA